MVGHHGFRDGDRDDLEQELALHWVVRMTRHDPRRTWVGTYADRALGNRVVDLIRRRYAGKRDGRKELPVDSVPEEQLADSAEQLPQLDVAIEVREALADLVGVARDVALLLMSLSEADVVRDTGMSRQRVRTIKQQIERHLRSRRLP